MSIIQKEAVKQQINNRESLARALAEREALSHYYPVRDGSDNMDADVQMAYTPKMTEMTMDKWMGNGNDYVTGVLAKQAPMQSALAKYTPTPEELAYLDNLYTERDAINDPRAPQVNAPALSEYEQRLLAQEAATGSIDANSEPSSALLRYLSCK